MSVPRFLADEDLRGRLVNAVRRHGNDLAFTTVNEVGLRSIDDVRLLEFAWQNRWLVVSHDANSMIAAAAARMAAGKGCRGLFLSNQ